MILLRLDNNTLKIYEKKKKNYSFYIIFTLKIFLAPSKKGMAAVGMFSQRRIM